MGQAHETTNTAHTELGEVRAKSKHTNAQTETAQTELKLAQGELAQTAEELEKKTDELDKLRARFKETLADNKRPAREKELLQEQVQKGASGDDARLELQKLRENYEKERAESQEAQAQAAQVMKEVHELQQQL